MAKHFTNNNTQICDVRVKATHVHGKFRYPRGEDLNMLCRPDNPI